jgi:hypothetical protein
VLSAEQEAVRAEAVARKEADQRAAADEGGKG